LTFGELKDFKPRADFVKGYLATGGIDVEYSPAFEAVKEGQDWIKTAEFDYGVICVSPKDTEKVLNELINDLPKDKIIDVAGKYDQENAKKWQNSGITDFIYKGQNQIKKLNSIKQNWERWVSMNKPDFTKIKPVIDTKTKKPHSSYTEDTVSTNE